MESSTTKIPRSGTTDTTGTHLFHRDKDFSILQKKKKSDVSDSMTHIN